MMFLNWPAFVLQRRISVPLHAAERALCDRHLLRQGATFDLGSPALTLRIDRDFGLTFPPFGLDSTSWQARASVRTRRGRRIQALELEVNAWDRESTELVVRPDAKRPHRWSGRRMTRYFEAAHASVDVFARVISAYEPADGRVVAAIS